MLHQGEEMVEYAAGVSLGEELDYQVFDATDARPVLRIDVRAVQCLIVPDDTSHSTIVVV